MLQVDVTVYQVHHIIKGYHMMPTGAIQERMLTDIHECHTSSKCYIPDDAARQLMPPNTHATLLHGYTIAILWKVIIPVLNMKS